MKRTITAQLMFVIALILLTVTLLYALATADDNVVIISALMFGAAVFISVGFYLRRKRGA